MDLLTSIYSWSGTSYGLFIYIMDGLAIERLLRAISDHNLGRVLVGHNHGRRGQSVTESIRVVGLQGLPDHACVMVVSDLKHVTKNDKLITYCVTDVNLSCLCFISWPPRDGVLKGTHTEAPFDMRTELHEAILVFANAGLDFSILL